MAFNPEVDLPHIPAEPGVYLMKDAEGTIIYVGKAANLHARVRQYFGVNGGRSADTRWFVGMLDQHLDALDVLITSNEKEALILESELIKRHQPRFNVKLKDDKSFLHLRIDERKDWPRVQVVRRPRRDGARYFGPYHSASKIRETLRLVERYFQLRTCDDHAFKNRARPCLQYQIKRCPAPCVRAVDQDAYRAQVREVGLFLQGKRKALVDELRVKMAKAAEAMAYEDAARYRDQILAVEGSLVPQAMVLARDMDRDVFGLYREGGLLQVVVLFIRRGRMTGSRGFGFDEQATPDDEVLSTLCHLFYEGGAGVPDEVLLPVVPAACEALTERLIELRGRHVVVKVPQRGAGPRLVEMAAKNAEHAFFQARRTDTVRDGGLVRLKERLKLANLPIRMECFDISIFQGDSAVGSQVVFEGGVPKRKAYRHYRIKEVEGMDDFAMMREVLTRRLKRGVAEDDLPQLIVVDGGKGQLGVAVAVLKDLGLDTVEVVGLAKARVLDPGDMGGEAPLRSSERVFMPGVRDPIPLRANTDELHLMTQLRDEAHRFAITYHRKLRGKRSIRSELDGIPGVGPAKKKRLIATFGSVRGVREASEAALAEVEGIGPALAQKIQRALDV